ncbi:MAG: aldehyde dehydrogenase family protein [Chloroflexi bacterium]|nr:aldehyde dehydrogenase family protein [Chloroflexota bacterium]
MTSLDAIQQELKELQANKDRWAVTGIDERIAILDEIKRDLISVSQSWVTLCMEAKGILTHTHGEGEEWGTLGDIYNLLGSLRQSLIDIKKYGRPQIAGPVVVLPNGQVSARVFPRTKIEAMLYASLSQEVWMEPGVTIEEMLQSQAQPLTNKNSRGTVNLVLGAGNASSLPVNDSLCKLFVENRVVILKLNPVNAYLGPLIEKGFSSLIDRGFFRVVYGGIAEGNYLCNHPAVDEIHLTGSDKTFESIVFGSGSEGARRKAQKNPLISKPVTGELGNITPVIIVPGPWSENDIRKQAEKVTTWLTYNAGCNCLTPRVLVQHKNWTQRETLIKSISDVMTNLETRKAYYPGAKERHAAFVAAHPEARQYGSTIQGYLPWTLIANVDPKNTSDICFNTEAFCSLFAETAIEAESTTEFIDRAVDLVNGTLWGTLTASIIIHPKSLLDSNVAASLERALMNLRYGTICINESGSIAYNLGLTPWGGFPGHDIYNVQSSIGVTNNALMFSNTQKAVVRGPFIKMPDPNMVTFKHYSELEKKFTYYLASPSIWRIPGIVWTSLRG